MDTAIRNCKIVGPHGTYAGGIGIVGEKIVAIARDEELPEARRVIDAQGNYVLPGLVDCHAHTSLFATDLESGVDPAGKVQSETRGCAFGGVTTLLSMAVLAGATDILQTTKEFVDLYEENSYVDFGITSVITAKSYVRRIRELADYGIAGFKLIMPFPGIDDGVVYTAFKEVARLVGEGYRIHMKVHCENPAIAVGLKDDYLERQVEPVSFNEARPGFLEVEAMNRIIYLANQAGCPLYIVHMTIKEGVDIVARAKAKGYNVVTETCPHYLALSVENTDRVLSTVIPPIRTEADNAGLWEGIASGAIDIVATDHVASRRFEKKELWSARPGMPGLETWLPVMLSEGVNKGRISLEKLVEVCSYNPARVSGLFPRKGIIAIGSDADLVIVDLSKQANVGDRPEYTMSDFSPYAGWKLKGWPQLTMVRGNIVMEDGKVVGRPGLGRHVAAKVR